MYNLALFMEADDLFPPIDEALIKKLNEIYPEKCPDIDLSLIHISEPTRPC